MISLVLDSKQIVVQAEREHYNKIRRKYQALATNAAARFTDTFSANFANIDEVHEKCTGVAMHLLLPVAEEAIRDLVAEGIFDIDIGEFEEYLSPYFTWDDDFAVVDDRYMAIVLKTEEADAYRTQRRQNRGKWVGGGFGIEGTIKGAAKAGAMNIATGALHGTFNIVAKGINAAGDAIKKNALFADPAVEQTLTDAVYRLVFNTHLALIAALIDKKPGYVSGEVSIEDEDKASRLLENVRAGRIPVASAKEVLIEAFTLNPYDPALYRYWLKTYGDQSGELETIETVFGLSVVRDTKLSQFNARRSALDLSSPTSCEAGLGELETYAASIGYQGFQKEREKILAEAQQLDRERRTVDGREYPTQEAANRQRESARAAIVEKDNTLTSTGKDTVKIAGAIVFLLFAFAMLMAPTKMFVWTAIPLGLSVASLQSVRSVRAMRFARGIGYALAGIGALVAVVDIASATVANSSFGISDFLVIAVLVGLGWGVQEIMRKRSDEAGYAQPKSLLIHAVIAGAMVGGVLFAVGSMYQKSKGGEASAPAATSSAPATPTSAAPSLTPAEMPPAPPSATAAFLDLYSVAQATGDKVTLASKEEATIWRTLTLNIDAGPRFVVLVARANPEKTSAADAAQVDAVSYRPLNGHWQMDAKAKDLLSIGNFGTEPPNGRAETTTTESHTLKPGMAGIFLPASSSAQGFSSDYLDVVGISNGAITVLGRIEVGGENSGACDNSVKDGPGACYNWKGKVQVQPNQADRPGDILIEKTGNESVDGKIVPASTARYVLEAGKGYQLQK